MTTEPTNCQIDTEFLEQLALVILRQLRVMTNEPIGIHLMVCTHGLNMRVSNMETAALKDALNLALQKAEIEGAIH